MQPGYRAPIAVRRTGGYDRDGRALWQLTEPQLYWSPGLQCWLLTLKGFITNYASVPRWPFLYAMYGDRVYDEPAGHDQGYTLRGVIVTTLDGQSALESTCLVPKTREQVDALFLESLLLNPTISEEEAHAMHAGVRIGGESSWRDETSIRQPEHVRRLILPADARWERPLQLVEAP
jgi:hypothetical protein